MCITLHVKQVLMVSCTDTNKNYIRSTTMSVEITEIYITEAANQNFHFTVCSFTYITGIWRIATDDEWYQKTR